MATYAIGDVQGCFTELQQLLALIQFNLAKDCLWFTGDLVNRGPQSLDVLRFVKSLGDKQVTVLGNHDLHLIAVAYGVQTLKNEDTLREILDAPDGNELIEWLRYRPLIHIDKQHGFIMTHAGIAPCWNVKTAHALANEVETILRGKDTGSFLKSMYGDQPDQWDDALAGAPRLRCITNYFTRMRFCYADGRLDLTYKGEIAGKPADLMPWFMLPNQLSANQKLIFGHWAALSGKCDAPNMYALDTGCVWGNSLTALRLEDEKQFSVKCG